MSENIEKYVTRGASRPSEHPLRPGPRPPENWEGIRPPHTPLLESLSLHQAESLRSVNGVASLQLWEKLYENIRNMNITL